MWMLKASNALGFGEQGLLGGGAHLNLYNGDTPIYRDSTRRQSMLLLGVRLFCSLSPVDAFWAENEEPPHPKTKGWPTTR